MRIFGSNATAQVASPAASRRAAAGGFSVSDADAPKQTAQAAALRTIGGIDALMALQGQDDPLERRRRAVKRGRIALDALDSLKVEVLSGELGPSVLARLKSATAELRDNSGDAGLDTVLAEIELRLEVEIAKLSPVAVARSAADSRRFSRKNRCLDSALVGSRLAHYKPAREQGGSCK